MPKRKRSNDPTDDDDDEAQEEYKSPPGAKTRTRSARKKRLNFDSDGNDDRRPAAAASEDDDDVNSTQPTPKRKRSKREKAPPPSDHEDDDNDTKGSAAVVWESAKEEDNDDTMEDTHQGDTDVGDHAENESPKSEEMEQDDEEDDDASEDGEDDDDEAMDEEPAEDDASEDASESVEPATRESTAVAASHAAATTAAARKIAPAAINLRLPSKHTPGKLIVTEKMRDAPPVTSDAPSNDDEEESLSPSRRLFNNADDVMLSEEGEEQGEEDTEHEDGPSLGEQVVEFVSELVGAATGHHQQDEDVVADILPEAKPWLQEKTQSCWTWFTLVLILHAIFWPLAINPGLDFVSRASKPLSLGFRYGYVSVMGPIVEEGPLIPRTSANDTAYENLLVAEAELARVKAQLAEELGVQQVIVRKLADKLAETVTESEDEGFQKKVGELADKQKARKAAIEKRQKELLHLQSLVSQLDATKPETVQAVRKALGSRQDLVVDVSQFQAFDVPECESPPQGLDDDGSNLPPIPDDALDESQVGPAVDALVKDLTELNEEAESVVWKWLEPYALKTFGDSKEELVLMAAKAKEAALSSVQVPDSIQSATAATTATTTTTGNDSKPATTASSYGLSAIRAFIAGRLEVDLADGTGLVDYASLAMGARIIHRETTPSLVDQLPLLNRVAALWGLRFYGFGPEMALTAGRRPKRSGQCWSLTPNLNNKAAYGILTVQLAAPVQIQSISMEHASSDPNSAVRGFRLLGYADPQARGTAQPLGSYEFSRGSVQQAFEVPSAEPMQAIALAMDSNWGGEYICLYRLRVHGIE